MKHNFKPYYSDGQEEWNKADFKQILEEEIFKGMKFGYKYHKDMHLISIMKEGGDYSTLISNVITNPMFRDCLENSQRTHIAYLENEIEEERKRGREALSGLNLSFQHLTIVNKTLSETLKSLTPWWKRIFS